MFPLNGYNVVGPIDPTNLLSSGVFEEDEGPFGNSSDQFPYGTVFPEP